MSDIQFICDGDEFFEYLWDQIDQSKVCCWILTYHWQQNSFIAEETLRKLVNAASRGVNVLLYVDYLNFRANQASINELEEAGGVVRVLNSMNTLTRFRMGLPILARDFFERYHQKLFLIDNNVIIGSANIDSDYGGPKYGSAKFFDLNIIIPNKCISESQEIFANIAERYNWPIEIPKIDEEAEHEIEILVSEPHYFRFDIQEKVLAMIENAQERILLVSGYYVHINKITKALKEAVARGVKVEMITSGVRDQPVYREFKNSWLTKHLRDIGVEVYEYPHKVLHMKAYIVDNEFTVGSFNNDNWSWGFNNELNLYMSNPRLTQDLYNFCQGVKQHCTKVTDESLSFRQMFWIRAWELFLQLSIAVFDRRRYYKLHYQQAFYPESGRSLETKYKSYVQKLSVKKRRMFNRLIADSYI